MALMFGGGRGSEEGEGEAGVRRGRGSEDSRVKEWRPSRGASRRGGEGVGAKRNASHFGGMYCNGKWRPERPTNNGLGDKRVQMDDGAEVMGIEESTS